MTLQNAIQEVRKHLPAELRIHPGVAPAVRTLLEHAERDGWTSVEEQMPPANESVVLYSASKYGCRQGEWDGESWYDIFGNSAGRVTHWKPLTPPKTD